MIFPALSFFLFSFVFILDKPTHLESSPVDKESGEMSNVNPLTSHVLDTAVGRPAGGIRVILSKQESNGQWRHISENLTNSDGRVGNLIPGEDFTVGIYKLYFDTKPYFEARGEKTFYPYIEVPFEIHSPEEHYHVPILISAYGFSTYRGS